MARGERDRSRSPTTMSSSYHPHHNARDKRDGGYTSVVSRRRNRYESRERHNEDDRRYTRRVENRRPRSVRREGSYERTRVSFAGTGQDRIKRRRGNERSESPGEEGRGDGERTSPSSLPRDRQDTTTANLEKPEKMTPTLATGDAAEKTEQKKRSSARDPASTSSEPVPSNGIVFLTKKQREELARQKAEELKRLEQQRELEVAKHRHDFLSAENFRPQSSEYRCSTGEQQHHGPSDRNKHSSVRDIGGSRSARSNTHPPAKVPAESGAPPPSTAATEQPAPAATNGTFRAYSESTESTLSQLNLLNFKETELYDALNEKTLEQIREHYLGLKKEKKKIQKPSEKFRNIFNFEWNPLEDTARGDSNALYLSRVEPQLLFGRGFRAGIDVRYGLALVSMLSEERRREQRRYNNFYDELVKHRAQIAGEDLASHPEGAKEALIKQRDIDTGDPNKLHWSEKRREDMTERDWRICREDFEIYIKGGRVPPPMRNWEESDLPEQLLEAIRKVGYQKPTPIQMQAIPIALAQRDLIGIAETGVDDDARMVILTCRSGKTAAFVLPMLTYVSRLPPLTDETSQDGPYALVLAPSRELAIQIDEETRKFASFSTCRAVAVVGGRSAEAQAFELRRGAEIVIGTPGRIKDCLERAYTVLSQCNYVVLDEADRMIDLGFEDIVNWILDQIPSSNLKSEDENQALQQELEAKAGYRKYRLTHMFSATMPTAVERLARKYLRSAAYISIGDPGAGKRAIEQRLEFLSEAKKRQRLQEILETAEPPIMVFVNQKKVADVLAKTLYKMGFSATSLHGGKAQDVREQSLADFKAGNVDILVATDVAGRGIDVEGVQLVVNFDMPKDIGSYTHRIGRTGRAGRKGVAVSFCTEDDSGLYYDLRQLLISTNNVVPLELNNHPAAKTKPGTAPVSSSGAPTITAPPSAVRFP